jgi:hypothetical protein
VHFETEIFHHGDPRLSVGVHKLRTLSVGTDSESQPQNDQETERRTSESKTSFPELLIDLFLDKSSFKTSSADRLR